MMTVTEYTAKYQPIQKGIFSESLVGKLFNFWHPFMEITKYGRTYKVVEGIRENKKCTYLLFVNENIEGIYYTKEDAKLQAEILIDTHYEQMANIANLD